MRKRFLNIRIHWLLSGLIFICGFSLFFLYSQLEKKQFLGSVQSQYVHSFENRLDNILKLKDRTGKTQKRLSAEQILSILSLEPEIDFIAFYDKTHQIVLASDPQYNTMPLSKIAPAELALLFDTHYQMYKNAADRYLLEAGIHSPPMEYDFKIFGIFFRADLSKKVRHYLWHENNRLFWAGIYLLLLSLLLFMLLRSLISRPLLKFMTGDLKAKEKVPFELGLLLNYFYDIREEDKKALRNKIDSENRLRRLVLKLEQEIAKRNIRLTNMQGKIKKETEQRWKLEEQARKMSRILECSPTSIVITDKQGEIEYVNPRFTKVTGYTFDEAIGQNPRILKSGDRPDKEYKELWDTITAGEIWRGLFHNKKKNGELYWEFAHIAPVMNEAGDITHYIAIKEDITSQKAAEEVNLMYAKALQSIGDMVTITDLDNRFIYVNDAFLQKYEFSQDEIIGKKASILLDEENPEERLATIVDKTLKDRWSGELLNKSKSGRVFPVFLTTSVIKNENDHPFAFVGISRDMSLEKEAIELDKKIEMLHTVQELAAAVSHEFSQPLQALDNYIGLMKMGQSKRKYLADMEAAVKRIAALVKNLRETTGLKKQRYLDTQILDIKASSQIDDRETPKVLVVDDEQAIKETLTEMISLAGYTCDGAGDGMEALRMVSQNNYQLIISDVNMPRMSGAALFDKVKGIGYKGAFIFMTGYDMSKDTEEIIRKGDGLLHKPVNSQTLVKIIQSVFQKENE